MKRIALSLLLFLALPAAAATSTCAGSLTDGNGTISCTAGTPPPASCTPPQPNNLVTACPSGQVGTITTTYACVGVTWTPMVTNACKPAVGDCPVLSYDPGNFEFIDNTVHLNMPSLRVTSFPLLPVNNHTGQINLAEGTSVPRSPLLTELTVSKCRGFVGPVPANPACYTTSQISSYNNLPFFGKAFQGVTSAATAQLYGYCWAPESEGPWYVNVRYTYTNCQYGTCGFVVQQGNGGY